MGEEGASAPSPMPRGARGQTHGQTNRTKTRLLCNLRPTPPANARIVTRGRGHFRSPDKDGGHTIQSAITENPMLHINVMALCFIGLPIEVLHCGNRDFRDLFAPVTR